ncbi:non-homologous end joining protein Ku [Cryobacterium tepidiphilum]|uniref:Non-homologous end joining protein Ku n=1 Tax=Cryobacterium tepidiphilum TaxID=2486026 RepID=A0A3M8L2B4_9MICO|nr:Ku protein [Cryobacterium tepidiphilum]RNE59425.1 Ku protein [Cryobacterium tepidiphilum]
MRSIWKGAITFGLVNVPVKVYSATEDHDISLHQVHDKDGGRIRYQRRCEVCGKVITYEHIDKAYDNGDKTVILTDEDLKSLPEERSREIEVVEFVPSDQIDPIMFDRSYFLEPDSKSSKAYVLLRRTLEATDRTAIVHFALRQKTRLAALRVRGDVLMIQTLLWNDEVREADFPSLGEEVRVSDKELEMSSALVDSFASDFTPDEFHDEYQAELRALIDAKLEQGDAVDTEQTFGEEPEEKEEGGEVLDLMEALRRSVERSRDAKKEAGPGTTATAAKGTAAKSAAAKGAAAKGAAAKGAKKPAASRTTTTKDAGADESAEAQTRKKKSTA